MRVSIKALAPLPALLFFASCVTPPPMSGPGRPVAYGGGRSYQEPDRSQDDRYEREAPRYQDRGREVDDRRFDDGRYNLRQDETYQGIPRVTSYESEPGDQRRREQGFGDRSFEDPVPPHERGDYSARSNGRISFLFGGRHLDDERFRAADKLYAFGVQFSQAVEPGTLGFEFGFGFAGDEEDRVALPTTATFPGGVFNVERDMAEVSAGVRAEFSRTNVRPYIGGGGVLINMSERRSQGFLEAEADDTTVGAYLRGGVQFDLNEVFYLGVDFRRVFGSTVELFDDKFDTDSSQLSFVLGLSL